MSLHDVSLDDKYDLTKDRVFITGTQALVRMCLMQSALDARAGLNTGGYVTGYRGSPLGALDQQFPRAGKPLAEAGVIFEPALNEDLAATAIWGTQQAELRGEGTGDGVFAMWYGKGPGVDRSGDVFRHGNYAGSSPHGGVLVLTGDDHTCESSTTAHQSEYALKDAMIPVFNPADIAEMVEYGLHGWAMSRYAGVWVGLKAVKDNVESSASVDLSLDGFESATPADHALPEGGLNIRLSDHPLSQEARVHRHKHDAVKAYVQANHLNRVIFDGGAKPRVGIITTGKSYSDTRKALEMLGVDDAQASDIGLSLMKIAMPWPLEPSGVWEFARGLDKLIVVEEKRGLMEEQLRAILYDLPSRPVVVGKQDEDGATLFQAEAALNPVQIAAAIAVRVEALAGKAAEVAALLRRDNEAALPERTPYFCAGCPHNSSTVLPEGARGYAGIGCHYMAQFMERRVDGYTQMGGEGANWIGEAKFSTRRHVFQNIGDGTYNHSGLQAIRAAIGSDVNMTFKILYNDAVAMTGGQGHEGSMDVYQIIREVQTFGAAKTVLVADDLDRIERGRVAASVDLHERSDLAQVQRGLSRIDGVTVLVYDQTCAAEKRRRRKRGLMDDPDHRLVINERVCEGCGDCGVQSNCVALVPVETEYGRKRAIDQSSCNKDYSCVKGFCPSFVSVRGIAETNDKQVLPQIRDLPDVEVPELEDVFSVALTGVGGTGVVTVGAILGMAAHLEGKGCGLIDMAGLAQKGGAVVSHIQIAPKPGDINAIRIAQGTADLVLGCDVVTSAGDQIIAALDRGRGHAVINTHEMTTGAFTRDPDFKLPVNLMIERIRKSLPEENSAFVDATALARRDLGNTIGANMIVLGVAYQRGVLPVSAAAIERAIELNGVSIDFNKAAFALGRQLVVKPELAAAPEGPVRPLEKGVDDIIRDRAIELTAYQSKRYAKRYLRLVDIAKQADGDGAFAYAVAQNAYKLMAYKDEYEVARLYDEAFFARLKGEFGEEAKITLHLAPPLFAKRDAEGHLIKREYGAWMLRGFGLLRKLKGVRGSVLDPFGYSKERKRERGAIKDYDALVRELSKRLDTVDYDTAVALVSLPEKIRGYGHVKDAHLDKVDAERAALLEQLSNMAARAA
jgi:indolepyruvate ferredoxin oxidoreductase